MSYSESLGTHETITLSDHPDSTTIAETISSSDHPDSTTIAETTLVIKVNSNVHSSTSTPVMTTRPDETTQSNCNLPPKYKSLQSKCLAPID